MNKRILSLLFIPFMLMGCSKASKESESEQKEDISLISLNETVVYIAEEKTYQLEVTVDPSLSDYLVFWSIRDETIASISDDGLITGISEGSTIASVQVGKYIARCAINITKYEPDDALNIVFDKDEINLNVNDKYLLEYEVRYGSEIITNYKASYDVFDDSVINLNNNIITALKEGSTDIIIEVTYNSLSIQKMIYVNVY